MAKYTESRSRGSSVSTGTRLRAGRQGFDLGFVLFSTVFRPDLSSTHSPIQRVSGAVTPELKRPRREADS
jgi:hypothetical protein